MTPTYPFTCPKCGTNFERAFHSPHDHRKFKGFCSRKCSNGRVQTEEANTKRRLALKGNHPRLPHPPRDPQQRADKFIATMKAKRHSNFESLGWECRRRCVIESQEGRCGKCQLSEWLGQPIPLEVDHINGDRTDHRRENLEAICPNCHAQTPTWRGRGLKILNDGPRLNSYTDEEILKLLIEHKTPSNLLRALGMSPRGGNYRRVNKALLSTLQRV